MPVYIKNQIQNLNYFKNSDILIDEINFINHDRYRVVTDKGDYLVNLYPNESYENFAALTTNKDDILEKGTFDLENIYELIKLKKTQRLDEYLKNHSSKENYDLGLSFGSILRKLHDIRPDQEVDWYEIFNTRANYQFYMHGVNEYIGDDDYILIDYINGNKHLTKNIRQSYIFNKIDYENILVDQDKKIIISGLDFKRIGDGVYDFARINKFSLKSKDFLKGTYDGYFNYKKAPGKFFRLLALYSAYSILKDLVEHRDGNKLDSNKEEIEQLLNIFDNFNTDMPNWIKEG